VSIIKFETTAPDDKQERRSRLLFRDEDSRPRVTPRPHSPTALYESRRNAVVRRRAVEVAGPAHPRAQDRGSNSAGGMRAPDGGWRRERSARLPRL